MSLKTTAYFRFDASLKRGAGHAMRSIVLADALAERGWVCKIVTHFETYEFLKQLSRFERIDPANFYDNIPHGNLLVIDHYDLDQKYESHFRQYMKKIMVIDDFATAQHDCDILLNQNIGFTDFDYQGLINKQCKLILGIENSIVNANYYQDFRKRERFVNLLFYMGGSGNIDQISEVTHECAKKYRVGYVEGFSSEFRKTKLSNYDVLFAPDQIKEAYEWSDVSIGFAGQGMFERYVMGVPMLIFSQNQMQHSLLNRIQDNNIIYCGEIREITFQLLSKKINQIKKSYRPIKSISNLSFLISLIK